MWGASTRGSAKPGIFLPGLWLCSPYGSYQRRHREWLESPLTVSCQAVSLPLWLLRVTLVNICNSLWVQEPNVLLLLSRLRGFKSGLVRLSRHFWALGLSFMILFILPFQPMFPPLNSLTLTLWVHCASGPNAWFGLPPCHDPINQCLSFSSVIWSPSAPQKNTSSLLRPDGMLSTCQVFYLSS